MFSVFIAEKYSNGFTRPKRPTGSILPQKAFPPEKNQMGMSAASFDIVIYANVENHRARALTGIK